MTREPVLPAQRAAVFAAVCLGLGVAAHRMMSGSAIPAWAVVLGGIGAYVPARFGTRRERGLIEITLLMGTIQIALHLLFGYAQTAAASSMHGMAMHGMAMHGMAMHGMAMLPGTSVLPGTSMPGMAVADGMRMGGGMLLWHAVAALACAWWLRRGEEAVHAVARSTGRWMVDRITAPVCSAPVVGDIVLIARVEPVALALRTQWLRTTRALRGPPQTPAFA
jgi:hypothetical protein